jgi:non-specific serine/threonine protein kinase
VLLAGRFDVGDMIGEGAMGQVFAGFDRRDARPVAVKRLRPEAVRDPEGVRRFAREGALLRAAAHPNIVAVLAIVDEDDAPAIVMERVDGGTLQALLASAGALAMERVLALALDVADALSRAHRLGVVHRDVKPGNVLLAADGTPRLVDFGLAAVAGVDLRANAGAVAGTLPYLCPEGWDGEEPTPAADVWALGVMIYEMLAGRRPFAAPHPGLLLAAVTLSDPPPLRSLRPDVPAALADAVAAMLRKDPADRMQSVRELALVAERLMRGGGASPSADRSEAKSASNDTLPRPATALVGREREVADVAALLASPETRLVTLSGPGGTGKTRLAIAAARRAAGAFADGAVWVGLSGVASPADVLPAIARALEVEEELHRTPAELLAERLADARMLLVLDNVEQVVDAAPELARLLERAPGVTMLATSRFLLRIAAERAYPVPPLALPRSGETVDELLSSDAVTLFVQRARALDPAFRLDARSAAAVAEICARLDGLPLAIELAAARSRVLPPAALLAHLDRPLAVLTSGPADAAERQRTLRRTIEWSVRLLSNEERSLFAALASFAGGWWLDDALAVAAPDGDLPALVDGLHTLLEKSLLSARTADGETRYGMLETLREYAAEMLSAEPDADAVRERHARHFAARAAAWSARGDGPEQPAAMAWFASSHQNLRAALAWTAAHDVTALPAFALSLARWWYLAGHWLEALDGYARALAASPSDHERAAILDARGRLQMFLGDEPAALADHRLAWRIAEATADARLRALAAEGLGQVLLKVGDADAAATLETASAEARRAGHPGVLAAALTTLATARVGEGAHEAAEALLAEALLHARRQGDVHELTRIHYYLAGLALLRGDAEACAAHCHDGRRAAADSGDASWGCHLEEMLGRARAEQGRAAEARDLVRHSLAAFRAVGSRSCVPHSLEAAARIQLRASGSAATAVRLLAAADSLCRALSIAMLPVERSLLAQTAARARAAVPAPEHEAAWREGAAASDAEVIAMAEAALAG